MDTLNFTDVATASYLDGKEFSENVSFDYSFKIPVEDRISILSRIAVGKRILHIGCCDHAPLIQEKISTGTWLHGILTELSDYCIGIDIDSEAVQSAQSISKLENIFAGDITDTNKITSIVERQFDYAIFGEVLEHIGNPVSFLSSFVRLYRDNINAVVITVPNAFRAGNIRNVFRSRETINSDHRFFFTPYTLSKVASDAGLNVISLETARFSYAGPLKRMLINRFPLLAENLIFVGAPIR